MKSFVITGASSGLGLRTSQELARSGHHVVAAVRNLTRGEQARDRIRASVPTASVELLECDLASLDSIVRAAATLRQRERPPLHGLICNAGLQIVQGIQRSADGFELTFAVNHLGHFLLSQLLLDQLTAPARIISVASEVHQGPSKSMGFPAPQWLSAEELADPDRPGIDTSARGGRVRYATSKAANILFTYALAERVKERGITALAFDPGLMPETGLDRQYPPAMQRLYGGLSRLIVRVMPGARSVERSAADLAWLATDPALQAVTGMYFSGRRVRRSSDLTQDHETGRQLWDSSERLVGLAGRSQGQNLA